MNESEQRQIARDSLFVLANLRVAGQEQAYRVKVRNLSAGGLMAESDLRLLRGTSVTVELRNIGWVEGRVVWVQDTRCGIAFNEEIDAAVVRANSQPAHVGMGFAPLRPIGVQAAVHQGTMRKV